MKYDRDVPESLLDLQKWMGDLLQRPLRNTDNYRIPLYDGRTRGAIEKRIAPGPRLSSAQRIGIYNQQFWLRLLNLMQEFYPTLVRLFGPSDFNLQIAEPYLLAYFPDHWSLAYLGRQLPQWIQDEYNDEDKTLVYQAALVDEAYERLPFARSLPPLSLTPNIAEIPLTLQPFAAVFTLDADLFTFRSALLEHPIDYWVDHDFPIIDWSRKRHFLLSGHFEEISLPQAILLRAFEKGSTLIAACDQLDEQSALEAAPHIGDWFKRWTEKGLFSRSV